MSGEKRVVKKGKFKLWIARVVKKGKFKLWIARDSQDNSIKKEIFRKEIR